MADTGAYPGEPQGKIAGRNLQFARAAAASGSLSVQPTCADAGLSAEDATLVVVALVARITAMPSANEFIATPSTHLRSALSVPLRTRRMNQSAVSSPKCNSAA
jgi:hypothetical protein